MEEEEDREKEQESPERYPGILLYPPALLALPPPKKPLWNPLLQLLQARLCQIRRPSKEPDQDGHCQGVQTGHDKSAKHLLGSLWRMSQSLPCWSPILAKDLRTTGARGGQGGQPGPWGSLEVKACVYSLLNKLFAH